MKTTRGIMEFNRFADKRILMKQYPIIPIHCQHDCMLACKKSWPIKKPINFKV